MMYGLEIIALDSQNNTISLISVPAIQQIAL